MSSIRNLGMVALAVAACGGEPPETGQQYQEAAVPTMTPCAAVEGSGAGLTAEGWAGAWRLTMVATTGAASGHQVSGPLTLMESGQALRTSVAAGFTAPWYGRAIVDVGAVGALDLGGIEEADSTAPGVLVMVGPGGSRAMIRLGTQANRVGQELFDGGYTVLTVQEAAGDSIRGTWRSGVTDNQATGHFCARRS